MNFYVWPASQGLIEHGVQQFTPGAVSFLCQNNFDFNLLFKRGLTY